jgi:hypothetical protein
MTNGSRESDSLIVSGKPSNKVRDNKRVAEKGAGQGEPVQVKQGLDTVPDNLAK